ncbi:MAG: transglutaminase N-terminal domain-containing protein, partial [Exilibacterium sp.]
MSIRIAIHHVTEYEFEHQVKVFPHVIRLKPAAHSRTHIHSYSLKIEPKEHFINWQQDPFGNFLARLVFPEKIQKLKVEVEVIADMTVINPFDFFVEDYAEKYPFTYDAQLKKELAPYLEVVEAGERLQNWLRDFESKSEEKIVDFLVRINQTLQRQIDYGIRME